MSYIQLLAQALKGYIAGFEEFGIPVPLDGLRLRLEFISTKLASINPYPHGSPEEILRRRGQTCLDSTLHWCENQRKFMTECEGNLASRNCNAFVESCFFTDSEKRFLARQA